eukprot:GHVP01015059.1.p1 GENE.GHVP01015059.1~~GHVP01015059.1.p1  ORF type:complete len:138 (+),score=22.73 GHVP01015059.1:120-533(+)
MQPNFLEGAFPIAFHPALNHEEDWTKIIGAFQNEAFQDELHFKSHTYNGHGPTLFETVSRSLITVLSLYATFRFLEYLLTDSCSCTQNTEKISKKLDDVQKQEKSFAEEVGTKITSEVISRAVVNALSERESQRTDY